MFYMYICYSKGYVARLEVVGRSRIRSVFALTVGAQRALRHLSLLVRSLLQLVRHLPRQLPQRRRLDDHRHHRRQHEDQQRPDRATTVPSTPWPSTSVERKPSTIATNWQPSAFRAWMFSDDHLPASSSEASAKVGQRRQADLPLPGAYFSRTSM